VGAELDVALGLFLLDYFADIGLNDVFLAVEFAGATGPVAWGATDVCKTPASLRRASVQWVVMVTEKSYIQFSSLFSPGEVLCQTEERDRDKILLNLLECLAQKHGIGNTEEAYEAVLARENDLPTIVAPGMAMPHARLDVLEETVVAMATSREGVTYDPGQPDSRVKLIVLTLAPKATPGAYLQAISCLATICRDPSTADVVASLPTAEQVWAFFDKGGMVLPDHLRACDVMDPVQGKLREQDTLQSAIDLFIRHRLNELPVVDRDGALIGVVSTYELLRTCLPDDVLWTDDLTPIMNFEPFAEVLRKENKACLAEIMTTHYATVEEEAPAIQIAREISQRRTNRVYVVHDRKLRGVASLDTLLNKILRA
jgi:mannitol/fructose-specific phosphotransferase system IIA component (Ntr-type)/CBS domain-containing protein